MERGQLDDAAAKKSIWNDVTLFSRWASLLLFVLLPFAGGWVGYQYAPETLVVVEKFTEIKSREAIDADTTPQPRPVDLTVATSSLRNQWGVLSKDILYSHPHTGEQYFVPLPERGDFRPFTTFVFDPNTDTVTKLGPSPINMRADVSKTGSEYVSVSKDGKTLYVFDLLRHMTITVAAQYNETFFKSSACELSSPEISVEWHDTSVSYGVFNYPDNPDDDWCKTYSLIEMRELHISK